MENYDYLNITDADIGFESQLVENMPIENLLDLYDDSCYVIINVRFSRLNNSGSYVELIYKGGKYLVLKGEAEGTSSISIYLAGIRDVIDRANPHINLVLITPAQIGFKGGFRGKGPNCKVINELLRKMKEKNITLKELYYPGGVDEIRAFLSQYTELSSKSHYKSKSSKEIYNACIYDVLQVLKMNNVDSSVVGQVLELQKNIQ